MFDHSTRLETASHAENEYAQALEETGIPGLLLILAFAGIIWFHFARAIRSADPPIRLSAFGLGVGLLAIEIHSLSDFGQHLPANMVLTSIVCALLVSLSKFSRSSNAAEPARMTWAVLGRWPARAALAALLLGAMQWPLRGAYMAQRADAHWRKAYGLEIVLEQAGWDGSNSTYAELLNQTAAACEIDPDNAKYRYSLNLYRWHAISRVHDEKTGALVIVPGTLIAARRICDDLREVRRLCPTYSHAYCLAGQLETYLLDDPAGAGHVRTGFELARCDLWACGLAARADAAGENWPRAVETYRRFLDLTGSFNDVIDVLAINHHRPDLALEVAANDITNLNHLADALAATYPDVAARAKSKAFNAASADALRADAPAASIAWLAGQYADRKDYPSAISAYRRALAMQYESIPWHLALARVLADAGQLDPALRECKVSLNLSPGHADATRLLRELSVRTTR